MVRRRRLAAFLILCILFTFLPLQVLGAASLRYGDRGAQVKTLQQQLNQLGHNCGTPDGFFGQRTLDAVKALQRACGLTADGIVGSRTWSAINNLLTKTGSGSSSVLKYGSRGAAVKQLQEDLNRLGYPCGTPDGVFGTKTVNAVKAFQRDNGLTADGIAGGATLAKINGAQSPSAGADPGTYTLLKKGSRGSVVKALQQRLNELGYNCGTADGIFGAGTEEAVRRFQRVNGLTVDGVAGPATQQKLYGSGAKRNGGGSGVEAKDFTLNRTLKQGSTGTDAKEVQKRLNQLGFDCGTPDGIYGSGTMRAAIDYQITRGLTPDGCVGPDTAKKLFSKNGGTQVMDLERMRTRRSGGVLAILSHTHSTSSTVTR